MGKLEDFGKETWFEKHGFVWDARIEAFVNRDLWKIFSKYYIDDHSFDTLLANLEEETVENKWKIYCNTESPIDVHNVHAHYGVTLGVNV